MSNPRVQMKRHVDTGGSHVLFHNPPPLGIPLALARSRTSPVARDALKATGLATVRAYEHERYHSDDDVPDEESRWPETSWQIQARFPGVMPAGVL
jgi:hypothetical protein